MLAFEDSQGVELTDEEAEASARAYDEAQVVLHSQKNRNPAAPLDQMLMYPCSQAAKAAAEDAAKAADEAHAATHEVKQENVRIQHNLTHTAHSFSILLLTARCVACVCTGRVGRGYGDDGGRVRHAGHENLR